MCLLFFTIWYMYLLDLAYVYLHSNSQNMSSLLLFKKHHRCQDSMRVMELRSRHGRKLSQMFPWGEFFSSLCWQNWFCHFQRTKCCIVTIVFEKNCEWESRLTMHMRFGIIHHGLVKPKIPQMFCNGPSLTRSILSQIIICLMHPSPNSQLFEPWFSAHHWIKEPWKILKHNFVRHLIRQTSATLLQTQSAVCYGDKQNIQKTWCAPKNLVRPEFSLIFGLGWLTVSHLNHKLGCGVSTKGAWRAKVALPHSFWQPNARRDRRKEDKDWSKIREETWGRQRERKQQKTTWGEVMKMKRNEKNKTFQKRGKRTGTEAKDWDWKNGWKWRRRGEDKDGTRKTGGWNRKRRRRKNCSEHRSPRATFYKIKWENPMQTRNWELSGC